MIPINEQTTGVPLVTKKGLEAAIILCAAMVAFIAAFSIDATGNQTETLVCAGIATSTSVGLVLWSGYVAMRTALWGTGCDVSSAILIILPVGSTVASAALLKSNTPLALAASATPLPCLGIALLILWGISIVAAYVVTRWAAWRSARKGRPWGRRTRFLWMGRASALIIPILGIVLLPCTLYAFSAVCRTRHLFHGFEQSWNTTVVQSTPMVLKDACADYFVRMDTPVLACTLLEGGDVSEQLLFLHLNSEKSWIRRAAWRGLARSHPDAAIAYMLNAISANDEIAQDYEPAQFAGKYAARHGADDTVRKLLLASSEPSRFQIQLLLQLGQRLEDFIPELEALCQKSAFGDTANYMVDVAAHAPDPSDRYRLLQYFLLSDTDYTRTNAVERGLDSFAEPWKSRYLNLCLDHTDINVVLSACGYVYSKLNQTQLPDSVVSRLISLLDHPDFHVRRVSEYLVSSHFGLPTVHPKTAPVIGPRSESTALGDDRWQSAVDAAMDARIELVRARGNRWLNEQKAASQVP